MQFNMWLWFILILVSFTSCGPTASPILGKKATQEPHQVILDVNKGLAFNLPLAWRGEQIPNGVIFSGPPEAPSYFSTITIQTVSSQWHTSPEFALEKILSNSQKELHPRLLASHSELLSTRTSTLQALHYSIAFRHHREPFHRIGLLLQKENKLIDLNYTANTDLFTEYLPIFENILADLGSNH